MSTIEDFENAPIGATATNGDGSRAMKTRGLVPGWITSNGIYLHNDEVEQRGYTLDMPRPVSVDEALTDAGLLARPLPTREAIARTLDQTGAFCGTCSYEPGDFYDNCADCRWVLDSYADAVLALLKGQEA